MHDELLESLYQIGFTKNEARVYLELLKMGPQAVSIIARKSDLNRTTTYSVLKALEKKGLVCNYNNDAIGNFVANDPNSLVGYIDRKCHTYHYYRERMLGIIPRFREMIGNYDFHKPIVTYFEGIEGVKRVMHDALNTKGEFRAYLCIEKWIRAGLKEFLVEYKNTRIMRKKVPLIAIAADLPEVRAFFDKHYNPGDGMTKVLYLKPEVLPGMFEDEINIYDDKVSILHLDQGSEYGVIIESKDIAGMHRAIFDLAWSGGESLRKKADSM